MATLNRVQQQYRSKSFCLITYEPDKTDDDNNNGELSVPINHLISLPMFAPPSSSSSMSMIGSEMKNDDDENDDSDDVQHKSSVSSSVFEWATYCARSDDERRQVIDKSYGRQVRLPYPQSCKFEVAFV